jgi:hypothetical protein
LGWGGGWAQEERVSALKKYKDLFVFSPVRILMYIAKSTCTVLLYTTVPLLPSTVFSIFLQFQHNYFLFSLCTHPKKQPAEEERKKEQK